MPTPGTERLPAARERYNNRARHKVYTMDPATAAAAWEDWAANGVPLGLGLTLTVGTTVPVDLDALLDGLNAALETLNATT